jgi:K+-transporting ATPase ATPase A chain
VRWLQYAIFLGITLLLARPLGIYLVRVFEGKPVFLDRVLRPVERLLHRILGVRPDHEMTPGVYIACFIGFGIANTIVLFLLLLVQSWLPGGPELRFLTTPMTVGLAANTAVSFSTTTTWQAYGGETTLRYVIQIAGLAAQNFLGGAAGLAVGIAFIRGFAREKSATLGNFWVDLVRALLWVLLPLSLAGGLLLVWQGVPLNLAGYVEAHTLEGATQVIPQGPVAALEIIKNLGTNGGGFFNANGAHPYETPTPMANLVNMLAIVLLPAALPITFGHMVGRPSAGRLLLVVMVIVFVGGLLLCDRAEWRSPGQYAGASITGGNMEGKETRFGIGGSVLAAVTTSNGATGSFNSVHDSYQPVGVLTILANMLLGEVVFGGLGTGLYGLIMVALVGVFLGGLMIGRTPEYLGKTIGIREMKLVALYTLITPLAVLTLTALASGTGAGRAALTDNTGPRAFTEMLFTYASCTANNGQNLAGLDANNVFYNLTTSIAMFAGRFGLAAFALALAGRLATQRRKEMTPGSLPPDTPTFAALLMATMLLVGALCFLPALALGPVAEQLRTVNVEAPNVDSSQVTTVP